MNDEPRPFRRVLDNIFDMIKLMTTPKIMTLVRIKVDLNESKKLSD